MAQTKVASPELLWLTIFLSIFVLVSVSVLVFYQYLHISVFESVSGPPGTGAGSFDLRSTQNWKYLRFCHKNICQLYGYSDNVKLSVSKTEVEINRRLE